VNVKRDDYDLKKEVGGENAHKAIEKVGIAYLPPGVRRREKAAEKN